MNPNDWHNLQQAASQGLQTQVMDLAPFMMVAAIFPLVFMLVKKACLLHFDEERFYERVEKDFQVAQKEIEAQQAAQAEDDAQREKAEAEYNSWTIEGRLNARETPIVTVASCGAACNDTQEARS